MVGSRRYLSYRVGSLALGLACSALGALGCTTPSFAPDTDQDADVEASDAGDDTLDAAAEPDAAMELADTGSAPQNDAADPVDGGAADSSVASDTDAAPAADAAQGALPAWAASLPGTYAKRSVTFSFDESLLPAPGNTRNVEYSIVTITPNGAELELSIQLCGFSVSLESASAKPVTFKYPRAIQPMTGRLLLSAPDGFSSEPMFQHLGFEPARDITCTPGERREKFPEQTWIRGATCQCSAAPIPNVIDDCRLTDSDGDGQPAVTATGQYRLTSQLSDIAMVFDYAVTFVDGRVATNRRHALREVRAHAASCVNASVDFCDVGNNELCPRGSTLLIPLAPQATCNELDPGAFGLLDPFPIQVDCRAGAD